MFKNLELGYKCTYIQKCYENNIEWSNHISFIKRKCLNVLSYVINLLISLVFGMVFILVFDSGANIF